MKTQDNFFLRVIIVILIAVPLLAPGTGWGSVTVDHRIFDELLAKHLKNSAVDYDGFKSDESRLDQYLAVLEQTEIRDLDRNEQFAFYINAYNAWTIKLILSGYPGIDSIKDLGSFLKSPWKKKIARIDGAVVTLDHIEHDILRPRFKDPRLHFAINCAAYSCPPLYPRAFTGSLLDRQLDEASRLFINNSKRNYLKGNTLFVSKIFKWFGEDFNGDISGFFLKYAEGELKQNLLATKDSIRIKYLPYDWSLNNRPQ